MQGFQIMSGLRFAAGDTLPAELRFWIALVDFTCMFFSHPVLVIYGNYIEMRSLNSAGSEQSHYVVVRRGELAQPFRGAEGLDHEPSWKPHRQGRRAARDVAGNPQLGREPGTGGGTVCGIVAACTPSGACTKYDPCRPDCQAEEIGGEEATERSKAGAVKEGPLED